MDELNLAGSKYISSKRASDLTGYAKDYIGQLARAGKIKATRVGRAWFIDEESLLGHAGNDVGPDSRSLSVNAARPKLSAAMYRPIHIPSTWSSVRYMDDPSPNLPELMAHSETEDNKVTQNVARNIVIPVRKVTNATPVRVSNADPSSGVVVPQSRPASRQKISDMRSRRRTTRRNRKWSGVITVVASVLIIAAVLGATAFRANTLALSLGSSQIAAVAPGSYDPLTTFINFVWLGMDSILKFSLYLWSAASEFLNAGISFTLDALSAIRE